MPNQTESRALVVVFDALRPEFVTPDIMPNLHRFASQGVWYRNSHATFFSETRVNQSVVTTGCMPRKHGIVANKFYDPSVMPEEVLNSGNDALLEVAFQRTQGRLLGVPTLGERLTASGIRYASFSAGTSGGGRLINHSAEADGTFRFAMRRPEAASPGDALERITDRIGPMPEHTLPAKDWIRWAISAYLDYIEPEVKPDVMMLWLCEPDETFHKLGIGSPESIDTIRNTDSEFGRILAHHEAALEAGHINIIAMSDHGQITLQGEALDLTARLNEAGFKSARQPEDGVEFVVVPGNAAAIWATAPDEQRLEELAAWLRSQDWCGPLFTKTGAAGTLTHDLVCLDHPRAPDIAIVFRANDMANAFGRHGTTVHDASYPPGGGCHGGLSRYELHNFLSMSGAAFKTRTTLDVPAGNVDITPTLLQLMGIAPPDGLDGRTLTEAFAGGPGADDLTWIDDIIASPNLDGPTTYLSVTDLGHTRYINRAWVK
jgi:phosphonoacetate hydrolase